MQQPIGTSDFVNASNVKNKAGVQGSSVGSVRENFGPLSAQNLIFLPSTVDQLSVVMQQSHLNDMSRRSTVQTTDEDKRLKYHRERDSEQQKHKMQEAFSQAANNRQDAQHQRDAMIAQMIGPLSGARLQESATRKQPADTTTQHHVSASHPHSVQDKKSHHVQSSVSKSQTSVQLAPDDLERMMQKYYDFNVDPKAQGFIKPTLNNMLNSNANSSGRLFAVDSNAANWNFNNAKNLEGVFVVNSNPAQSASNAYTVPGVYPAVWKPLPRWLSDVSAMPKEYVKLLHNCVPANRFEELPDTGLVYVLLRTSGLSNDVLGAIWSLVNRSQPGQLTKTEFFAALALVAFAQKTNVMPTLDVLDNLTCPLIPSFYTPSTEPVLQWQQHQQQQQQPPMSALTVSNLVTNPTCTPNGQCDNFADFQKLASSANSSQGVQPDLLNSAQVISTAKSDERPKTAQTKALNSSNSTPDLNDPFDILGKTDQQQFGHSSFKLKNSVSENATFVFQSSVNELGVTYQIGQCDKSRIHKNLDLDELADEKQTSHVRSDASKSIFDANNAASVPSTFVQPVLSGFSDIDYGSIAKFAYGTISYDSPDSGSLHSKEPSLHSLDLKSVITIDSNEESRENEYDTTAVASRQGDSNNGSALVTTTTSSALYDRYAAVRESDPFSCEEKHIDAWTKVLEACLRILQQFCDLFERASTTAVCREIVDSQRGATYLKSVIEVYKVSKRIGLSLKTNAFQTEQLVDLLADIENAWDILSTFVAFSEILPQKESLAALKGAILKSDSVEDQQSACGVCLLNVNFANEKSTLPKVITYSGRCYHSHCANFWVNCVESLLPALKIPNLL